MLLAKVKNAIIGWRSRHLGLQLRLGRLALVLDLSWVVSLPVALWLIARVYVAILGAFLDAAGLWAVSLLIGVLGGISLLLHVLAHAATRGWAQQHLTPAGRPSFLRTATIPVYLFGDAAQAWPVAGSPMVELLAAAAGPAMSGLLAVLAYMLWNAQLATSLNIAMPLLAAFNAGLAIANLTPVFPLDGGRLIQALFWGWMGRPVSGQWLATWGGAAAVLALAGWGIFLIAQGARFSWQTGLSALAAAAFVLWALLMSPPPAWHGAPIRTPVPRQSGAEKPPPARRIKQGILTSLTTLICLVQLALATAVLPTNSGLEAPGVALSVEPMIDVPTAQLHTHAGTLLLTSVIQQTPITLGEWVYAKLNPTVALVPPERIVPRDTSLQEQARQGFRMLDESEIVAKVVGLRLAGYDATATGHGALVVSLLPDSPNRDLLQPGDIIRALNGQLIQSTADLTRAIRAQPAGAELRLHVEREGNPVDLDAHLMPPVAPGGTPRLGIIIEAAGYDYALPFPVEIRPQKIVGGPSAGLMFTLTLYNLLSPTDLTGGRRIAGTGTISLDGSVGPIGGVELKVAAAEAAGASYFLSPADNYAAAAAVARRIHVVRVTTAAEAVAFLHSLPPASN